MNHRNSFVLRMTLLILSICLIALSTLPVSGSSQQAIGATITVNTLVDEFNSGSDCSLREAIRAAMRMPFWWM